MSNNNLKICILSFIPDESSMATKLLYALLFHTFALNKLKLFESTNCLDLGLCCLSMTLFETFLAISTWFQGTLVSLALTIFLSHKDFYGLCLLLTCHPKIPMMQHCKPFHHVGIVIKRRKKGKKSLQWIEIADAYIIVRQKENRCRQQHLRFNRTYFTWAISFWFSERYVLSLYQAIFSSVSKWMCLNKFKCLSPVPRPSRYPLGLGCYVLMLLPAKKMKHRRTSWSIHTTYELIIIRRRLA